jgi:hypothetical protein
LHLRSAVVRSSPCLPLHTFHGKTQTQPQTKTTLAAAWPAQSFLRPRLPPARCSQASQSVWAGRPAIGVVPTDGRGNANACSRRPSAVARLSRMGGGRDEAAELCVLCQVPRQILVTYLSTTWETCGNLAGWFHAISRRPSRPGERGDICC